MLDTKWFASVTVAAVVAMGATCKADDAPTLAGSFPSNELSIDPAAIQHLMDAPAGDRKPLMLLMDKIGIGHWMDQQNISLYGYAQGSYTYNFNRPAGSINDLRLFDYKNEHFLLNQIDLTFEKTVDMTKPGWDYGFRVEGLYGSDSATLQSNGLNPYGGTFGVNHSPENQFNLLQAYVDILAPIGSGLRIRVGKFFTLLDNARCKI